MTVAEQFDGLPKKAVTEPVITNKTSRAKYLDEKLEFVDDRTFVWFREIRLEALIVVPATDFHHNPRFIRSHTSIV